MDKRFTILQIDSSARMENSVSRKLTAQLTQQLASQHTYAIVKERILSDMIFLSEAMVEGMFTPIEKRTPEQIESLHFSDFLVEELKQADALVIGLPNYNFGIPASLKAYIDLITRSNVTFKHTAEGFFGLLPDKPVYIVITSGSTALYGPKDFISDYMKFILSFIGLNNVTFIDASKVHTDRDGIINNALQAIGQIELNMLAM
ncbi:MAG: NAD(P)H-dependent oxidoreductase [Filimonas sp.]|nr:NAD(P)H-dependent oxidoreductase [Filimonas sp.]